MKEEKCDMVNDVAQLECNNNKYYTLVFRYIYIYIDFVPRVLFNFKFKIFVLS